MPLDVRWPFPQCPALSWRISSSLIMGMVGSYSYFWTSELDYTCAHWHTSTLLFSALFLILLLVVFLLSLHIQSTWTVWQSTTMRFCWTWSTTDQRTRPSSRCPITSPVWMTHTSGVRRAVTPSDTTPSFHSGLPGLCGKLYPWFGIRHLISGTELLFGCFCHTDLATLLSLCSIRNTYISFLQQVFWSWDMCGTSGRCVGELNH